MSLSSSSSSSSSSSLSSDSSFPSPEEWMTLRNKVQDAQKLATELLGLEVHVDEEEEDVDEVDNTMEPTTASTTSTTPSTTTMDLAQAMNKFTCLQEELTQLQRESQLTQRALIATQCSQTFLAKRLDKIQNKSENEDGSVVEVVVVEDVQANADDEEEGEQECLEEVEKHDGDDNEDEDIMEDVPSPEDDNLEQEIMNILPTKSRSLGVGLLGDMEQCIVEWQQTFRDLHDQYECQVQACQADLERMHVRLDAMQALHPCTGVEAAEAAQKARDQLEELVQIVEEFPSKARVQALQNELAASKQAEEQTHMELALAFEELEALRQREQDLLRRLEVATRPPIPFQRPKTGPVPTVRLLRHTKKKLQRLFRLDRYSNKNYIHKQPLASLNDNSSTSPSISEGALLDTMVESAVYQSIDLSQLESVITAKDDSPLGVTEGGDEVDLEELSMTDSLEHFHRHDVLSVYGSPTKSHSTEDDDDLNLCKMDTDDTTSTRSEVTETETDSTSGTPPPKLKPFPPPHEPSSKTLFHMAKSLWWVQ